MTVISRKRPGRTAVVLVALSVALFALSCWVYASRQGLFSLGWTSATLKHIRHEDGFAYIARTHHPELSEEREPSSGVVLENGVPLSGPADSRHDDIRRVGRGGSSFWGGNVYFSPADNSSPLTNGRTYEIRYPRYVTDPYAFALYAATILLFGASIWFATRTPDVWCAIRRVVSFSAGPLFYLLLSVSALLLASSCAAYMNRHGMLSLGWKTAVLAKIKHETGFAFIAPTHNRELSAGEEPSLGVVLENGLPLPGPADAKHDDIRAIGRGRSSFWGDYVYFASSDNSPPSANGRVYEVRYPRILPSSFAFAIYSLAAVLLGTSIWFAAKIPELRRSIGRVLSFSAGPHFYVLVTLSVFLLVLSGAIYANREGLFSLGWKTEVLTNIHPEDGFAFRAPTFHPELSAEKKPSLGIVLENGIPLPGSSNASHDEVRELGNGCYSFWGGFVYFSASDSSAPDSNGRSYAIRYPRTFGTFLAFAIYTCTIVLFGASICVASRTPEPRHAFGRVVSYSISRHFYGLLTLSVFLFVLSCAIYANREGLFSLGWRTDMLNNIHPENGFAFRALTHHPELGAEDKPPSGIVLENGVPLPGAANASHDEIRELGKGRYSFWSDFVYFSSSDNSPPGRNGRSYSIRYPGTVATGVAVPVYTSTLLLLGVFIWYVAKTPEMLSLIKREISYSVRPPYYFLLSLSALSFALSYAAFMNREGMLSLGWRTDRLANIHPDGGFSYSARTFNPELGLGAEPSTMSVQEDGLPLPGPAAASHRDIHELGNGRYSFWGALVYFSTSDNTSPGTNRRIYEIRYPTMVSSNFAHSLYTCTVLLVAASAWFGRRSPELLSAVGRASSFLAGTPFPALVTVCLVFLVASGAAYLNHHGAFPLGWRTDLLTNIQHEIGFAYSAPTHHPQLGVDGVPTSGIVLENGVPLSGETDAKLTDIRTLGKGRSEFWGGDVYFSTPDNSKPDANGRYYEIRYPSALPRPLVFVLYTVTILLLTVLAWILSKAPQRQQQVKCAVSYLVTPPFFLPAAIVVIVFLTTRIPFFLHYPIVGFSGDSASYLTLVSAFKKGQWPQFLMRTPVYPLLVWPFTFLSKPWLALIYFQNLLSLASALCLVYAIYRLSRSLTLPAAVAMAAFLGGTQVLLYDTSVLSESVYTSTTVFAVAFLFLAFGRQSPAYFSIASATMALVILIRPAGIYFAAIYVLIILYLLWNRYPKAAILRFLTPFPAVLLTCCAYNYLTLGYFVITPFGEANLAGATVLYWEPDPSFPEFVNKALKELPASYKRAGITPEDFNVLRGSWDPYSLVSLYDKQYNKLVWAEGWGSGIRFGPRGYLFNRQYIRQVSMAAIRRHPNLYAKYIWANLAWFFSNIGYHYEFYAALKDRVMDEFITQTAEYSDIPAESVHVVPSLPTAIHIGGADGDRQVLLDQHFLKRLHVAWETRHWALFLNTYWIWTYFIILLLSAVQLLRFRGHHLGAFLLFVISLVSLGAGLVVALVELAMNRYSYPTQFIFYLAVALTPLLFSAVKSRLRENGQATLRSHQGVAGKFDGATDI